jgi:hypothetical protein
MRHQRLDDHVLPGIAPSGRTATRVIMRRDTARSAGGRCGQTVVFMAYVTAHDHALSDFRLYLPTGWCASRERRERAQIPDRVQTKTRTELGTAITTAAISAGAWSAWAASDDVHGRASKLRAACERAGKGYVPAVPSNFTVTLPSRRKAAAAALASLIPARYRDRRPRGPGCKGHRDCSAWLMPRLAPLPGGRGAWWGVVGVRG